MADMARTVRVHIDSVASIAARLPSITGVVAVPRLTGWTSRPFADLMTRVRGEIVRAVTSNEARMSQCTSALQSVIEDANPEGRVLGRAFDRAEACKAWCVTHRNDAIALQALCENKEAPLDVAIVSMIIDSSVTFGEMGRSRVLGSLAERVLQWQTALASPDGASRVLKAAQDLPWEAPGHEAMARAVVALDKGVSDAQARQSLEQVLSVPLAEVVQVYAEHPRIAVVEEVARACDRPEVLQAIADRAGNLHSIDSRMTFRLIAALASNREAPPEIFRPFADAQMWTKGSEERKALGALLDRVVEVEPNAPERDLAPAI